MKCESFGFVCARKQPMSGVFGRLLPNVSTSYPSCCHPKDERYILKRTSFSASFGEVQRGVTKHCSVLEGVSFLLSFLPGRDRSCDSLFTFISMVLVVVNVGEDSAALPSQCTQESIPPSPCRCQIFPSMRGSLLEAYLPVFHEAQIR